METSAKTAELNLALQVALQTMKERCVALQKRLTSVEEENQELRERIEDKRNIATPFSPPTNGAAELFQLRLQLSEMQRQKVQMNDHVNMVSDENRKLWSRLSQIAKEHEHILGLVKDHNDTLLTDSYSVGGSQSSEDVIKARGAAARAVLAQQNLIRSKTFTQHSPNPNLRHKMLLDESAEPLRDQLSLEEIALEDEELESDTDTDYDLEVKRCQENMQDLERDLRAQNLQLKTVFNALENKLATMPCPDCIKRAQKPEMADKSLETDDSLSELQQYNVNNNNKNETHGNNTIDSAQIMPQPRLNIIQEKIQADTVDKTCPMCGRTYNNNVSFDDFRQHVEQHFIDDTYEAETIHDRSFEFVSHSVGEF